MSRRLTLPRTVQAILVEDESHGWELSRYVHPPTPPLKSAVGGMFLGASDWVDRMRGALAKQPEDRNVPARRKLKKRPTADDIVGTEDQEWDRLLSRLEKRIG